MAGGVGDDDPAFTVDLDRAGRPEHSLGCEVADAVALADHVRVGPDLIYAPLGQAGVAGELADEAALRGQDLDPVVQPVCHVDIAVLVDTDAGGAVELSDGYVG